MKHRLLWRTLAPKCKYVQEIPQSETVDHPRSQVRIQRGGQGVRTPPGKSQVIWVSIGSKQLDPPPWKKLDPPPLWKYWTPSGTLKSDRFLWNWPFDFCKISWGLKKTNAVRAFFCQTDLDPPPPPLTKIPGSAHGGHEEKTHNIDNHNTVKQPTLSLFLNYRWLLI